jgi:Gluconate 2-dehydrogenase subunit 3
MTLHFLTEHEHEVVARCAERLLPPHEAFVGGASAGAADYIDLTLGAFEFDPPRIWAGGPFSGRFGGAATFDQFIPLSRIEELAWRTRIEGSRGISEREWSGPVRGWQAIYREGIERLGGNFLDLAAEDQDAALDAVAELKQLLFEHACEACYGAPEYGGNRDLTGWLAIGLPGDVQPRGWTDEEVSSA